MLSLFPALRRRTQLMCAGYLAFIVLLLFVNRGVNPLVLCALAAIGLVFLILMQLSNATKAHSLLLARLYHQLDVEGFLREYEPMLAVPLRKNNLYLMVRLHISNAYCALGRFDDAAALLKSVEIREDKPEQMLIARFAVASNLCYCAEQQGDLKAAETYLLELRECKRQLDEMQRKKPEKKRAKFYIDFNEQCYRILSGEKADIEPLRAQVQQQNTQQLHRITTSLWIARAYLAEDNRSEAERLLRKIAKIAPDLYPGKAAKALLDGLSKRA